MGEGKRVGPDPAHSTHDHRDLFGIVGGSRCHENDRVRWDRYNGTAFVPSGVQVDEMLKDGEASAISRWRGGLASRGRAINIFPVKGAQGARSREVSEGGSPG